MEAQAAPVRKPMERLHFLDWLRFLMVLAVVYAHTAKSGLKDGGGFTSEWAIDDRTIYEHPSYRAMWGIVTSAEHFADFEEYFAGAVNGTAVGMGPSPLAVRWISIVRQWCLPMLFWVSGAAVACSYRGGFPRGIDKLAVFLLLGVVFNAMLWLLSPQDDSCEIDKPACQGQGVLFDFTIAPHSGWFVYLFQMWYIVVLIILTVLDWPLFAAVQGSSRSWALLAWFPVNVALGALFILGAGQVESAICPTPWQTLGWFTLLEALFVSLSALEAPEWRELRPDWLEPRLVHYLLGAVAALQIGAVPYAKYVYTIGLAYLSFMVPMCKRFFELGYIMTRARRNPEGDLARPLLSRAWPFILIIYTFMAPSTNWDLAGMLTYPYFEHPVDRTLYSAGGVTLIFIVDRASRGVPCDPLPEVLGTSSLVLYLFHPVLISVLLALGVRNVLLVWLACLAEAIALVVSVAALRNSWGWGAGKKEKGGLNERLSDTSEDEESKDSEG